MLTWLRPRPRARRVTSSEVAAQLAHLGVEKRRREQARRLQLTTAKLIVEIGSGVVATLPSRDEVVAPILAKRANRRENVT